MEKIGIVDGYVKKENSTVGPRHDPYGRDVVTFYQRGGVVWRLYSCGLAGEWLEDGDKQKIAELREVMFADVVGDDVLVQRRKDRDAYEEKVMTVTGMPAHWWMETVWAKRDAARWRRMTPREREQYHQCMEADAALMRYAM